MTGNLFSNGTHMMTRRWFIKVIYLTLIYLSILLNCGGCSNDDCYQLETTQDFVLVKGALVILDDGIVGFVDEIQNSNGSSIAKFCLPSAVRIPKNSKVYVGFIPVFGSAGIKIVSSNEAEFIHDDERLHGLLMDSIELNFPPADTALRNKIIDIAKDKMGTWNKPPK
jgi:hypothetical protein